MATILWENFLSSLMRLWGQRATNDKEENQGQEKISLSFPTSGFCSIFPPAFRLSYKCWAVILLTDLLKLILC